MLRTGALTALLLVAAASPAAAQEKQPPYWASIASGQAMTHTGPGRNYPNVWLYQRRDLPVRVIKKYENWRLIQDPDGAQGWMLVTMLSDRRTAMTHTGPGRNYPNVWLYQRRDLPVRVIKKYENWRLIQDPDGAQGWMLVTMLSDRRTAMVKTGEPKPIRVSPDDGARVAYQAQQGVVGRVSKCSNGWCRIDIGNCRGYIRETDIWGVADGEVVG